MAEIERKPFLTSYPDALVVAALTAHSTARNHEQCQRLLGEYLISDSSGLVVSTAKEVADTVGVSESTVVRFAKELG